MYNVLECAQNCITKNSHMNRNLLVQLTQHKSYWEGCKNIPHYSEFECDLGKLDT